jgi:hypothetical protein
MARAAPPPEAPKAPETTTAPTATATGTTPAPAPAPAAPPAAPAQPAIPPASPLPTSPKPPESGAPAKPGTVTSPAVGAPSVPPPPSALPGGFPPVEAREFEAMAKLKLKVQGPDVAAATFGDKIVITLPLPEPPPPPPPPKSSTSAKPSAGTAGTSATSTATASTAPAAPTDYVHYYAIRAYGPKNDRSAFSNQAALIPRPPPPSPRDVKVTAKADGVEVSWTEPAPAPAAQAPAATQKIVGFNVYRRDASTKTFGKPVRAAFPDSRSIVDNTARFGDSYIYGVTAIVQPDPLVESAIQSEAEIQYADRFPPPVPTDVVALAEAGKVRVVWRASAAPDLAGYLVYRREGGAGAWKKLTEQPIAEVQYLDGGVAVGATYSYRVTAVDKSGNESAPGETQTKVQ